MSTGRGEASWHWAEQRTDETLQITKNLKTIKCSGTLSFKTNSNQDLEMALNANCTINTYKDGKIKEKKTYERNNKLIRQTRYENESEGPKEYIYNDKNTKEV